MKPHTVLDTTPDEVRDEALLPPTGTTGTSWCWPMNRSSC